MPHVFPRRNALISQGRAIILIPAIIRFIAGIGGACLLLYIAANAQAESGLTIFLYVQHSAIVVATFAKLGSDAVIQADAEKQFHLGAVGALMLLGGLALGSLLMVGFKTPVLYFAVLLVAALTVQNALLVALSIRDMEYMRGAWETAWTLPALYIYVGIRGQAITELEIVVVCGCLLATRLNHRFRVLLSGPTQIKLVFNRLSKVWFFQLLNLLLFRSDQSTVSFLGARKLILPESVEIMFWAKANDLCNAVATALGGVANREELDGRSQRTVRTLRLLFPFGCVTAYIIAWLVFGHDTKKQYLLLGLISVCSATLSYEINRLVYINMWAKNYNRLILNWATALVLGLPIIVYGGLEKLPLFLPLGVLVQLASAVILLKIYGSRIERNK